MAHAETRKLVLITGPVASGKSTLAEDLARVSRDRGLRAASIDMDDLVFMVAGKDWRIVRPGHWRLAREAAASLIDTFFSSGMEVVTLAGPFFGRSEREHLVENVRARPRVCCVVLRVTLREAIARAYADVTRSLSKDPALIAELEKTINSDELPSDSVEIATDGLGREEVVRRAQHSVLDSS